MSTDAEKIARLDERIKTLFIRLDKHSITLNEIRSEIEEIVKEMAVHEALKKYQGDKKIFVAKWYHVFAGGAFVVGSMLLTGYLFK